MSRAHRRRWRGCATELTTPRDAHRHPRRSSSTRRATSAPRRSCGPTSASMTPRRMGDAHRRRPTPRIAALERARAEAEQDAGAHARVSSPTPSGPPPPADARPARRRPEPPAARHGAASPCRRERRARSPRRRRGSARSRPRGRGPGGQPGGRRGRRRSRASPAAASAAEGGSLRRARLPAARSWTSAPASGAHGASRRPHRQRRRPHRRRRRHPSRRAGARSAGAAPSSRIRFVQRASRRSQATTSPGATIESSRAPLEAGGEREPASIPSCSATSRTEQAKTLKCGECGTMNYPTEWYCERCGAELARAVAVGARLRERRKRRSRGRPALFTLRAADGVTPSPPCAILLLWRAALFLWIRPLRAARSRRLTALRPLVGGSRRRLGLLERGAQRGALGAVARSRGARLPHVLLRGCDIRHE